MCSNPTSISRTGRCPSAGLSPAPGKYTLDQIRALPKATHNTRHVCVEGWDVVGRFGGARMVDFLTMVGADPRARFVTVTCADEYYESLDIETALQPQSLLCYEMYGRPLDRGHGAPLRLNLPTKLGYKQAKYLMTLDVTHVLPAQRSYWADEDTAGMPDSELVRSPPQRRYRARFTNIHGRSASRTGPTLSPSRS
jgi:DMSO/TMAO reductase YedYZ molybdopterin-dependent catalytic subunit